MDAARRSELIRHLTSISRKVLDATPITETWSVTMIGQELYRRGTRNDPGLIAGCLHSLKDDGLVLEPHRGFFIQAVPKHRVHKLPTQEIATVAIPGPPLKTKTPAERLADLSAKMVDLASEIDAVGIELTALLLTYSEDSAKLKQFRNLLKE